MGKQMLKNDEWNRNVGSPAFPVSLLHEYAVGLIWERLHGDDPVTVLMMNGELSGDLRDGMRYVQPGRPSQTIAGQVPDLVIYDAQLNPVRVIEVTVTSPLTDDKRSRYENLDIEVIEVPIRSEADLIALYPPAFPHGIPWGSINEKQYRNPDPFAFGCLYIEERIIRKNAEERVDQLIEDLITVSPATRRKLLRLLQELVSIESQYPLTPDNPKHAVIASNRRGN